MTKGGVRTGIGLHGGFPSSIANGLKPDLLPKKMGAASLPVQQNLPYYLHSTLHPLPVLDFPAGLTRGAAGLVHPTQTQLGSNSSHDSPTFPGFRTQATGALGAEGSPAPETHL